MLKAHLGLDLRDVLYPSEEKVKWAEELINQTWITQPALFTIEYALAKLWMAWGIQPRAMVGHSIGEYVAACISEVFSLEAGLALVAARGKMIQGLTPGGMLSVPLAEADIIPFLGNDLSLAVINGPAMCVVSGPNDAIERLHNTFTSRDVMCRKLHTSHAFHSMMMEPILPTFIELVRGTQLNAPKIPYLSNKSGGWVTTEQATSPEYWAAHLRGTVHFAQNVETLFKEGLILLEVGPGQTLSTLARQHSRKPANQVILSSMRHPQEAATDTAFITKTLGRLWLSSAYPDWSAYHAGETLHRIGLPTYPFERKRYWLEPKKQEVIHTKPEADLGKRADMASWFYVPSWQRSVWPATAPDGKAHQNWLVFCDELGVAQALAKSLEDMGQNVVRVIPGGTFRQKGEREFELQAENRDHYIQLIENLSKIDAVPTRIAHMWTLTAEPQRSLEEVKSIQSRGFYSLLALAQALGEHGDKQAVKMLVVSNQMHEVTGGEVISPAKATLLGPCMVIPQEYANLPCRSLDIVLPQAGEDELNRLVHQILAEFSIEGSEPVAAQRGVFRWVQSYVPLPLGEVSPAQLPLHEHGVYLITGGYGGIGLTLARFLAQTVKARLALVGRSGLPERSNWQGWLDSHLTSDRISQKITAIRELENNGAQVLLFKADVTDAEQMRAVIAQVKSNFGSIQGVIHAAGIAGGGLHWVKIT